MTYNVHQSTVIYVIQLREGLDYYLSAMENRSLWNWKLEKEGNKSESGTVHIEEKQLLGFTSLHRETVLCNWYNSTIITHSPEVRRGEVLEGDRRGQHWLSVGRLDMLEYHLGGPVSYEDTCSQYIDDEDDDILTDFSLYYVRPDLLTQLR